MVKNKMFANELDELRFLNKLLNQEFNLGLLTTLNPEMQECTTL